MTPLLECEDVRVGFRRYVGAWGREVIWPVSGISLRVERQRMVAVVGASGAGKSLLAHAMLGILPANAIVEGDMALEGTPLTPETVKGFRGKRIALVPQTMTALDPLMRVGRLVLRSAELAGKRREEAHEAVAAALHRYALPAGVEHLYPHQLSGGMARRVLLAAATVSGSGLIVADEPTPGLDIPLAREVLRHLRQLADDGRGVVLITHDLGLALEVVDEVVVVLDGRSVDAAPRAHFSGGGEALAHAYTRALWLALPENGMVTNA